MAHVRQQIRDYIKDTVLVSLASSMGAEEIFSHRPYPDVLFPAIHVFTANERAEIENDTIQAPRRYTRMIEVTIDVRDESVDNPEDSVDLLAAQIEALMEADRTFGGITVDIDLSRTVTDSDFSSEVPFASALLTYRVFYRTTGLDPQTAL